MTTWEQEGRAGLKVRKETGRSRFDRQAECGRYSAASSSGVRVVFKPLLTQRTQRSAFYSDSRSNWPLRHKCLSQFGRWFKCWFELCFFGEFVCWSFFRDSFKNVAMLCSLVGTMNLVKPFRPTGGFLLWWLIKERDLCHWVLRDCFLKFSTCLFRL